MEVYDVTVYTGLTDMLAVGRPQRGREDDDVKGMSSQLTERDPSHHLRPKRKALLSLQRSDAAACDGHGKRHQSDLHLSVYPPLQGLGGRSELAYLHAQN